jgi:hypothetical protein
MIPYEELVAALERYAARAGAPAAEQPKVGSGRARAAAVTEPGMQEPPTAEHVMPPVAPDGFDDDAATSVGELSADDGMQPIYDINSQELAVLSDEDVSKP